MNLAEALKKLGVVQATETAKHAAQARRIVWSDGICHVFGPLLQVKNRSNSENSSSSTVRGGSHCLQALVQRKLLEAFESKGT